MEIENNIFETLPEWNARYFYRKIAEMAEKYFEDPEVRKRFRVWQKKQREREAAELAANGSGENGMDKC